MAEIGESIDFQIIDDNTIKIDSYSRIDYKGYLGVLKSPDIGKAVCAVLNDLQQRKKKIN